MIGLNEFIEFWSKENSVSKTQARKDIETFIDTYKKATYEHGGVTIRGFMQSSVVNVPERKARNPKTGETVKVAPKTVVKVKALKNFKNMED